MVVSRVPLPVRRCVSVFKPGILLTLLSVPQSRYPLPERRQRRRQALLVLGAVEPRRGPGRVRQGNIYYPIAFEGPAHGFGEPRVAEELLDRKPSHRHYDFRTQQLELAHKVRAAGPDHGPRRREIPTVPPELRPPRLPRKTSRERRQMDLLARHAGPPEPAFERLSRRPRERQPRHYLRRTGRLRHEQHPAPFGQVHDRRVPAPGEAARTRQHAPPMLF